jgi:SAM-dependent methyltransferase
VNAPHSPLMCPACRGALRQEVEALHCDNAHVWPVSGSIADFSGGVYFDHFSPDDELRDEHVRGLQLEVDGARRRIDDFYLRLIRDSHEHARVLDCGCGNGVSVDVLAAHGVEAWGNDLSALRKWQWREREQRQRLVVASALTLPFADGSFDVVLSSGLIEHLGVDEWLSPHYTVRARPDRHEIRRALFDELARVVAPRGRIYIDCPNRLFPIDFWHSDVAGRPRIHPRDEPFLPSFDEIAQYAQTAMPEATVTALSPYKRLQFQQSARHWYGRLLAPAMNVFFRAMQRRPLRALAKGSFNPFLVVEIRRDSAG